MGIMSFIRSELIDIIEWLDETNYTLVYRFPDEDHEVKNGAKLICRPGQAAILVSEGKVADVFGEGTHTLSTNNVPLLSTLRGWKHGFESPYKVEIYFVNLRQYIDQKWGTANPVLVRDPEFGVAGRPGRIRIRARGTYNYKIEDPRKFFEELVTSQGMYSTDEIAGYLRKQMISNFSQAAGKSELSVMDMAANYGVLADGVRDEIEEEFDALGLKLTNFMIENISLPPEVEKAIDAAAAQSARGVDNTMAWEGMAAMRDAAKQSGGGSAGPMMGAGMGVGMGMGMGQMMGQMMNPAMMGMQPNQSAPQPATGQPAAGQPAAAAPAAQSGLESKLRKLKAAYEAELLTEEEYKTKRAQLLADF